MPYIKQILRNHIDGPLREFLERVGVLSEGELNYIITQMCHVYLRDTAHDYRALNAVVGVLTCAKDEFVRRVVAPYEDRKIAENGDVT